MDVAETVLLLVEIYLVIGVLFTAFYFWRGQARLGHAVTAATWSFRIIIVPSLVGLWPLLIWPLTHSSEANPWPGGSAEKPIAPGLQRQIQTVVWLGLLILIPLGMYVAIQGRAFEWSPHQEVSELVNVVKQGAQ
jgi:hypothetical protein